LTNHEDINWGNTSTHGVNNKDLRLVRTSPHIDRWASDGSGSLIITPREDSSTYSRSTTHFTLNSIVQDHSSGTFSSGKYAVIGSLEDAAPRNTISGIGTVDTWMHPKDGKITLPNATLFAPEGEKLPERFDGLNVVRYAPDSDQAKNYSNLTSTIKSELSKNNIPTFEADSYGWHGVGMPPKEEVENLSRLVGSDKKLPTIHFGSPDSTMEGYLSNILKLKKYTEEDSFSPGSQSPMQQIDELEWNGKQYFDNVHPDTVDKYKQKEAEYLERTRAEVEKWKDKHFPPEPVNILPEGFPLPNGSSTAIPPPVPSNVIPLTPSGNLPGTSIPPPIPTNMPVDTPLDMIGKSSEWTPKLPQNPPFNWFDPRTKEFKEVSATSPEEIQKNLIEAKAKWEALYEANVWDNQSNFEADMNLRYGINKKPKDYVQEHKDRWSKLESDLESIKTKIKNVSVRSVKEPEQKVKKETAESSKKNSVKNFFNDKINIKSFDTETTGLDVKSKDFSKRSRIYELGLATSGIDGVEAHVNPFFIFDKDKKPIQEILSKSSAETRLKEGNGGFSRRAYAKGNFDEVIKKFPLQLAPLDDELNKMFENVKSRDVIVLQNMNFENKILKSSFDQGLISKETYEGLGNRMNTVSLDKDGGLLHLFERPVGVQEKMREADMIFNTEYLFGRSEESFQKYRNLLNESMEIYKSVINDPNRAGAVAVELMDVTKTFMANAADKGLIDKEASTLGLNMDFLMQALSMGEESHTAMQDAKDTITVYQKLSTANQELLDNNISDETKSLLTRITEAQPKEVNKRFLSTIRSITSDFNIEGKTKLSNRYSWYAPEVRLREGTNTNIKLDQVLARKKATTTNIDEALLNALDRYSIYNDNLEGFNRKEYVDDLLKNNTTTQAMHSKIDVDYFKGVGNLSNNNGTTPTDVPLINKKQSATVAENIGSKLTKKHMGLAALGGLAFMAFQGRPDPVEKNYDNVSEQFYDEQYLGTAFVDFRERNKHYMM
jgi:hypothetical protein